MINLSATHFSNSIEETLFLYNLVKEHKIINLLKHLIHLIKILTRSKVLCFVFNYCFLIDFS